MIAIRFDETSSESLYNSQQGLCLVDKLIHCRPIWQWQLSSIICRALRVWQRPSGIAADSADQACLDVAGMALCQVLILAYKNDRVRPE